MSKNTETILIVGVIGIAAVFLIMKMNQPAPVMVVPKPVTSTGGTSSVLQTGSNLLTSAGQLYNDIF